MRSIVLTNLSIALAIWLVGFALFLLVTVGLSFWFGYWALIFVIGHPALGVGGHIGWCRKHGINWLTCEPRDRYLELRPWAQGDGFPRE